MPSDTPVPRAERPTFLDCEAVAIDAVPRGAIAVIGLPGATPYAGNGAHSAGAPAAIRTASARHAARRTHYDFDLGAPLVTLDTVLVDCGDLAFDETDFTGNRVRIEAAFATLLGRGARPLLLGGDDSVQIPALRAFAAHGKITLLQIDAHIDWRDEVEGERFGPSSTMRRASEMAGVGAIVQIGARGIGSARESDVADAVAAGARLVDMRTLRAKGLAYAVEQVPEGQPVVVCCDVDGLDPTVVPGVVGRAPGGLGYGDIVELLHGVAVRAPIVGFNLVEFTPQHDLGDLGARTVCRLAMLGAGFLAMSERARSQRS
ncbi:arginase family protein [Bosea sp. 685]|uniref:arginase family protein n=1 Tax=Bosea sp. 685 TaxID=3080057 RepID=UPI00289376D3|nr:arginase family protein [Bosea sp. 685]WNJ91362.1 arginase family protein [Bosea sp. 685]